MTNGEKLDQVFPDGICPFSKNWLDYEYKEPTTKNNLEVDCISRQQAIDAFPDLLPNMGYNKKAITEILQEVPPVTLQEPRWIPVSERLPEDSGEYHTFLVTDNKGRVTLSEFYLSISDKKPYWSGMINVIAWMPLPKAYSEVKDANID